MAASVPKRRKLDHADSPSIAYENLEEQSDFSDSSEEEATAQAKKTVTKQKRSREDADSAVYAGGLFKSSMFKLQVDEMLAEVKPNYEKRLAGVNDALRKLKSNIESIAAKNPCSVRWKIRASGALY
jgi:U3 small nucleolar RNA-associated protein 22